MTSREELRITRSVETQNSNMIQTCFETQKNYENHYSDVTQQIVADPFPI